MKTLSLTILITFLTFNSLFAQSGWYVVGSNISPDSTFNDDLESVFFTDANTGYVAGYTYVYSTGVFHISLKKTTNAGMNWFLLSVPPADTGGGFMLRSVYFTDVNTGYVAGGQTSTPTANGIVLKTTNGGSSWFPLTLPIYNLFDYVYFFNSSTGYVSGYGTILKTTDGGASWIIQMSGYAIYLFQICFTDVNTGYVVGNNGNIFKTTNGGNNWISSYSGTVIHLFGIDFVDANTGVACGGKTDNTANVILRTTNGGNTWSTINYTYSTCLMWRVRFISSSVGYIIGYCSQILKTNDGGASWCNQTSPVNCYLRDCFFTNVNTGYIAGAQYGYILKTTNGGGNCIVGITSNTNEIPAQFNLYQNYPNPFNPSTKIKFALPKSSFAKLVVYDILGKEVVTLVNEQLNAGSYEVEWNAGNYPSGTYFYKLTSENYSEIKKMVLVK